METGLVPETAEELRRSKRRKGAKNRDCVSHEKDLIKISDCNGQQNDCCFVAAQALLSLLCRLYGSCNLSALLKENID
jgi:hypothetical protein